MDGGVLTQIGHPVVVALNAVSAGLDEAADADVWSLSDDVWPTRWSAVNSTRPGRRRCRCG
jgi:hypothetical protein